MNKMNEDEAIKILKHVNLVKKFSGVCSSTETIHEAIETILDLYKELQNENARLKYLLRESSKIIDEYTNETENDTKKIIEYRKKYLEKGDKNEQR